MGFYRVELSSRQLNSLSKRNGMNSFRNEKCLMILADSKKISRRDLLHFKRFMLTISNKGVSKAQWLGAAGSAGWRFEPHQWYVPMQPASEPPVPSIFKEWPPYAYLPWTWQIGFERWTCYRRRWFQMSEVLALSIWVTN